MAWTSLFYELLGPHRTHALTILICFTLTGFFVFLLARRLGFDFAPSFLAGLIFSFSPLHFANTAGGRVELTFQWVPLCLLFLLRWMETRTWPSALGLWISFVLLFYSNWYLTLYTVILGACWAALLLWRQPGILRLRSFWVQLTVMALLSGLSVAPLLSAAAAVASSTMVHSGHILFSADVLGLFIPGEFSLWGGWTRGIWQDFIGLPAENGVFFGYVTLVLAFLGLRRGPWERHFKILCLLLAAAGIVLSLGPYLKIGGVYEVPLESLGPLELLARKAASLFRSLYPSWSISPDHIALPLPYLLLKEVPYFSFSRVPSRFLVLTYMSLALLAGSGLMALTRRSSRKRRVAWSAVLVALVCIEFFPQMRYRSLEVHPFIHQLGQDPDGSPLMDLSPTRAERLLHQLDQARFSQYSSIYIPDPEICVTRITEPKNRSPKMSPAHETGISVEVPCSDGDAIAKLPTEDLVDRVRKELSSNGLLQPSRVLDWQHHVLPNAYPVYDLDYRDTVQQVLEGIEHFENLRLVGRQGLFFYSHLHDQFQMGRDLVKLLPSGSEQ